MPSLPSAAQTNVEVAAPGVKRSGVQAAADTPAKRRKGEAEGGRPLMLSAGSSPGSCATSAASPQAHSVAPEPRRGGLLDAMRQRGTLPLSGVLPTPRPIKSATGVKSVSSGASAGGASTGSSGVDAVAKTQKGKAPEVGVATQGEGSTPQRKSPGQAGAGALRPRTPSFETKSVSAADLADTPQKRGTGSGAKGSRPRSAEAPALSKKSPASGGSAKTAKSRAGSAEAAADVGPGAGAEAATPQRKGPNAGAARGAGARARTPSTESKGGKQDGGTPQKSPGSARAAKGRPAVPAFPSLAALAPPAPEPWQVLRELPPLPPKNSEDNYEISDHEDSDDEADRPEPDRSKKHVPSWAVVYSEDVVKQGTVDPDSIFGVCVPSCDLEVIFPDSLYLNAKRNSVNPNPKRKRGSSCMWMRDRLSRHEINEYRRKMGQLRRWSMLRPDKATTPHPTSKVAGRSARGAKGQQPAPASTRS